MVTQELEQLLLEELGYANSPSLQTDANIEWSNGRSIPHITAALSIPNGPIAYFSRFSELDPEKIQELHKNVWSQSKAPLLFVTLPHEIRIYNGYEPTPTEPDENFDTSTRLLQHLTGLTDHLTAQQAIKKNLVEANHYERIYLETGAFWDTADAQKIKFENRADQQLVEGMKQMRQLLNEAGLSNHLAYTLLGRSILIRYLEDRGILTSEWVQQLTDNQASSYRATLPERQVTYLLYERLSERFNGDLFPVEEVEKDVTTGHLAVLLSFLNRTNLATGQLSLWPYNFEYIPIELISNIYDTFLDNQRASGAYYTPLVLADFILEETMGTDVIQPDMTILDPACGSGIFLVGAYRRLIQAWRRENGEPSAQDLSYILQRNIFGVDKNEEAVRIAAFSLYLEILNHLSNEQIRNDSFHFPSLQQQNLWVCDFFEENIDHIFADDKFDRIVGNMPWGRGTLTKKGEAWLKKGDYTVGGKQAAPAFMLRVPEFCKTDGEIALLAPTKSTILVTSETHKTFRDQFFTTYDVRAVVNFSALVYELFPKAISPAVAIFYTPNSPSDSKLVYAVPKPSPLSQHLKAIVLDTTEVKFLSRDELLTYPELWKVALWGNPRDAVLIKQLVSAPTLEQQAKNLEWEICEGYSAKQKTGKPKEAIWLKGLPFLPTNQFQDWVVKAIGTVEDTLFERPRRKEIYIGPLALIHHSRCRGAFLEAGQIAYKNKISGVVGHQGQESFLKWLVACVNSPLLHYYHFLTSTSWAVERGTIIHNEYKAMPFIIPEKNHPKFQQVLHHFDQIIELLSQDRTEEILIDPESEDTLQQHQTAINELVFELYNLHPIEQQLVEDMLDYGLGFFNWSKRKDRQPQRAKPIQRPDVSMLETYAEIFTRTATSLLNMKNQTLNGTIYKNGAPLTVVSFDLVSLEEEQPVQVVAKSEAMRAKLRALDELLLNRKTPSMYARRHVRIYDGQQLFLVRPSEQRFWTQSQARADADAFLAELSS